MTVRIFDWILGGRDIHEDVAAPGENSILVPLEPAPWRKTMNDLPRIIADNAAEYIDREYVKHGTPQDWDYKGKVLLPPFDDAWMESVGTGESDKVPSYVSLNIGFRIRRFTTDSGHTTRIGPVLIHSSTEGREFVVAMPWHWDMYLDKDGVCYDAVEYQSAAAFTNANVLTAIPVIALDWINSNNIELVKYEASKQQQRKCRKRNRPPRSDYYCIEIGAKYRKQWEKTSGGVSATRFHTVAGSWAVYTCDKPRFGRHRPEDVGRFWRRGSAAGDKSLGTINKEYRITDEVTE